MFYKYVRGLVVIPLIIGCGGAGSSVSTAAPSGDFQSGSFSLRVSGRLSTPVSISGRGAVITALSGASISQATLRMPPMNALSADQILSNTDLVIDKFGQPFSYHYGSGQQAPIAPNPYLFYFDSQPTISAYGNRVAYCSVNASGRSQIALAPIDGTSSVFLSNLSGGASCPTFSPDGTKIAFWGGMSNGQGTSTSQIFVVPTTGGTPVAITSATDSCQQPAWSPDGTKIAFFKLVTTANGSSLVPYTVHPDGTSQLPIPNAYSIAPPSVAFGYSELAWYPNSSDMVELGFTGTSQSSTINSWIIHINPPGSTESQYYFATSTAGYFRNVSIAPTGDRMVYTFANYSGTEATHPSGMYTTTTQGFSPTYLGPASWATWGPYLQARTLVGTGPLGTVANALMYGQSSAGSLYPYVSSALVATATTPSSITVTSQANANPNQPVIICTIAADAITSLKYMNNLNGNPVVVQGSGSSSGAVVSYSADTGKVISVLPYVSSSASRVAATTYRARFLSAYSSDGKNMAPSGASEITLDPQTGKVLSIQ